MDTCPLICHRCSVELEPGSGNLYVIRIEAFANPTPPTISADDLQRDLAAEMEQLVEAMRRLSPQEAMDQVYRRLTIHLCNACYGHWIENPTGT